MATRRPAPDVEPEVEEIEEIEPSDEDAHPDSPDLGEGTDPGDTDPDEDSAPDVEPETGDVKVKSPSGSVTTVPRSILQSLLDSGYRKTK